LNHSFTNQVVIVTGASTGIGRETAVAFAQAGARVVLAARTEGRLRELAATRPDQFLVVPADVTNDADVVRLVETTIQHWGRIDILVNNAGCGMRALVETTVLADAERLMAVNFFGLLRCTQAVIPHMRRQGQGQIVNLGSLLSVLALPGNSVYSASKFAVRALSDALRLELREVGIDVILIMPGYTDTPFFENQFRYGGPAHVSPVKAVPAASVARAILRACRRRQREVVLTMPGKFGAWSKRWFPRLLDWGMVRVIGHRPESTAPPAAR
jgi:short-subunit dehydrogenase